MRIGDLLPDLSLAPEVFGREATAIAFDSRKVCEGALFFAIPGAKADGLAFAAQAVANGACAIVAERAPAEALSAPVIVTPDVRLALSRAASLFYPAQPRTIAAVTGTSGKTSVAAFLRQIWLACGRQAASLGTIGLVSPSGAVYGSLTTPDSLTLHQSLSQLAADGVTHLAMEASSHGLDQRRLDGVKLSVGAFTNLSRDHLDYHADLDDYLAAKLRLFGALLQPGQPAVIDADTDVFERVAAACRARGLRVMGVGRAGDAIRLVDRAPEGFATRLTLECDGRTYRVLLPLAGAFQTSNALVAAGMAIASGESPEAVFGALEKLEGAPGRIEMIGHRNGGAAFVDYAHKPGALETAIAALRPFASGRLIVVFGCGGDRDAGKRAIMGEISARDADITIVTDDNPRSEQPAAIRAAIMQGANKIAGADVREIGDRGAAIAAGVALMGAGDILLVAGKGHETGQIVGSNTLPFSDHGAIRAALGDKRHMNGDPLWSSLGLVAPLLARSSGGLPKNGVTGVSIDTRTLQPGDLFVAIIGENSDGHDYVRQAFEKGAAAAVIDEAHALGLVGAGPLYVVKDTLFALEGLGRASRARSKARIVAVTGSVGKTTTKEALRAVLGSAGEAHASAASYNNHWGVPLTLARMPASARYGVFEIGMNHAGEITPLVGMVRPHVVIVTRIAPVHLEHFESLDAIADAKAEIFTGLVKGGVAILNCDDAQFPRLQAAARASLASFVLTFGESEGADARLVSCDVQGETTRVTAEALGQRLTYTIGAPGRHIAMNSLAVLLAARATGLDLQSAAAALARFSPPAGRGQRETLHAADGAFTIIDESYNANPASMRAAVDLLGAAAGMRRIAVLGDMLELGPQAEALHAAIGADLERNGIDLVFAAGPLMRSLYEAIPAPMRGAHARNAAELEKIVLDALRAGDVVMIKGSNGSRMGPLVAAMRKAFAAPADAPA